VVSEQTHSKAASLLIVRLSDTVYRLSDTVYRLSDTVYRLSDTGGGRKLLN